MQVIFAHIFLRFLGNHSSAAPEITLMLPSQKKKLGHYLFLKVLFLMQRLTVLNVIIHETTAHVMSSFDPLHALGLLVCITALSERSTL